LIAIGIEPRYRVSAKARAGGIAQIKKNIIFDRTLKIKIMDPVQTTKLNTQLSAAITAAISLKMEFELYAYRVIKPEQFIENVTQIVNQASRMIEEANDLETEQPLQKI
jgi:hypothetical protein